MATTTPPRVAPDLSFLLSQASHVLATELTARLADLGISPRAQCVLSRAMGGELTQIRLAELSGLDKTTMVVTIDELENAGYAERRASEADRRARIIAVTEAGVEIVAKAQKVIEEVYEDVLSALPERQREAFVDGLELLAHGRLSTPVQCSRTVRRRAPRS